MNATIRVGVGAVIFQEGKVLLVLRKNEPAGGWWAIPGGKVRSGERLEEALRREIREETGLEISPREVVYVFDLIEKEPGGGLRRHYVIIDYDATVSGGRLRAGDDALKARWFTAEELDRWPVHHRTRQLLREKYDFG